MDTTQCSSGTSVHPSTDHPPSVIDLTHTLVSASVPACPGHPHFQAHLSLSIAHGDEANVSTLTLGSHTGTHLDAPYHFVPDGQTVDAIDLALLTAVPAIVVDLRTKTRRERIGWADLAQYEEQMRAGAVLLLCTGWSRYWGKDEYNYHPFLDQDAAKRVMDHGVRVIGVDALGPDEIMAEGDTAHVHRVVLGGGGIIVENLNGLERLLDNGWRDIVVSFLPLKLAGCDGSPIRAVAWKARDDL